ncbi:low affinity immunoglobulin gamma Fc region receptor II-a-like isoform X1 [Mastacembelus armatus]|uniref:low affinity immunoglobulin gamma Fc region receptor II-a-like isoform X1 n=1 Tax=Mastacembelus armatus TaxID=205130 RepID=UPI000E459540|nr:low affinity immunoglobulin gamma Fc region receptor II-a-like isoform X1 [Mastacembelus armatus]XP_026180948.1 low affinity immunoglobulin gamma Fc region receptor II-a-like isoform X1 [Mastacembelus armatus]XP_033181595.1 low affinity immunoglobulin gamma Fc region receptor II-a-like isoform X1 [Mastacembelus armatus]
MKTSSSSSVCPVLNMLLLLPAQCQSSPSAQGADAAYPRIEPDRLQFFEYESVSLNCSGFPGPAGWRVMRKQTNSGSSQWENSTRWLLLKPAFVSHSGEYWCESGEGERSRSVNISVTAADVILESPALPVMGGQTVTLRCRKWGHSNLPADFYKDGHLTGTGYDGEMIIESVSKSDEGFYKCSISGAAGASAESWLAVTGQT